MARRPAFLLKKWRDSSSGSRVFVFAVIICGLVYLANALWSEIRPSNIWGLSYGTAAAILMVGAALLALRRRMTRFALARGLGNARVWLQFHLYGGALFLLLTFMHSGFHQPRGILTWWLWFLSIYVTASGIIGVLLQKWIPKILTSGLAIEVVYERIPELIREISDKANALAQTCTEPIKDFYKNNVALALAAPQPRLIYCLDITGGIQSRLRRFEYVRRLLASDEKEKLNKLEAFYKTKLEIDAHYTLQRILRWWLFTHVPVSLVLLILLALHLFAVLYY